MTSVTYTVFVQEEIPSSISCPLVFFNRKNIFANSGNLLVGKAGGCMLFTLKARSPTTSWFILSLNDERLFNVPLKYINALRLLCNSVQVRFSNQTPNQHYSLCIKFVFYAKHAMTVIVWRHTDIRYIIQDYYCENFPPYPLSGKS